MEARTKKRWTQIYISVNIESIYWVLIMFNKANKNLPLKRCLEY